MNRSALLGLVALLAACSTAPSPAAAPGGAPAGGGSTLRRCGWPDRQGAAECVQHALLTVMREQGVGSAMQSLEGWAAADATLRSRAHEFAHALGLAALTPDASVGETFRQCTPAFQSGCYHGVIQAYFVDHARRHGPEHLSEETITALCADHRAGTADRWLLFQCTHGMGHGLTMLLGYDLPRALRACDLAPVPWEREACYGGAFMENVVQAIAPHHGVGRPETGGHAHHAEHAHPPTFRPLDPSDPLYPCSALEPRYLNACYQMQTSVMLHFNGGDYRAAAQACGRAPELFQHACFQSLGRDISARTQQSHARAIRLCSLAPGPYRLACHEGFVKHLVDLSARAEDGLAFCRALPDAEAKAGCHRAVGEQVWVLDSDDAGREVRCGASEPGFREWCRVGAGLSPVPATSRNR